MRVLIVEQNHLGHYYNYDRLLIGAVGALGAETVMAITPEGFASPEFRVHLSSIPGGLDARPILRPGRGGTFNGIRDAVANLNRAVKEIRPDVVYVVTADGIAQAAGLAEMAGLLSIPRNVYCECSINRLAFAYPNSTARLSDPNVRRARSASTALSLLALRKSPFARIHLIDALAWQWIQTHGGGLRDRVDMIPDPVEEYAPISRAEARKVLGIPEDGRYLVCPGLLDNRKGIPLLIGALSSASLLPTDRLVLAGPAAPDVAATLKRDPCVALCAAGRLIVIDRVLSEREIAAALWAADVVVCTYPHQPHPASIALKALACGRPTLASDTAWLGRMIPKFKMGWTVNVLDSAAFSDALGASLDRAATWRVSEAGKRLIRFSSAENFKNQWTAGLRRRMNLPPCRNVPTWNWVLHGDDPP
ncbi:MAG TPA: glycosyltransferase family 4 protein [Tepidisphaeraceae bacterium]|jgi:glycosyltransferase involved in cell wall biosynthesis|nr:glycosyltransferase family 4 protein [Tepidisphaeraceae bacterium]